MWPFGAVLDVKEHADTKDHIFDNSYVPLHWDGMYKPTIPEFQLFHCVSARGRIKADVPPLLTPRAYWQRPTHN